MGGQQQLLDEIIQLKIQLRDMFFQHYFEYELFSPVWWVAVALLTIPLAVWWRYVDKKRVMEICIFGLVVNLAASFLDVVGSNYMLWEYPVHTLPGLSLLIPVDYVIVPVVGMVIYQRFDNWKKYLLVCTIASAVMSFACEPFAAYIGMYRLITWEYIYSFPIYILIYVGAKLFTGRLKRKNREAEHP